MTADELRAIRRRLGLTQAAFALRLNETVPGLNVKQPHIARWESGRVKPSGVVVAAIERIYSDSVQSPESVTSPSSAAIARDSTR